MADLGTIRHLQGEPYVLLNIGRGLLVDVRWINLAAAGAPPHLIEELSALEAGVVIDPVALRRNEVIVLREAPTRLDDATLEAISDMGGDCG